MTLAALLASAIAVAPAPAGAQPGPGTPSDSQPPIQPATPVNAQSLVRVHLTGWLRARGQWIRNGSLGNGTSGIPATLGQLDPSGAGSASDDIALSQLRLRLEPSVALGARARIDTQLDVAGGTVLGAHPTDDSVMGRWVGFAGNGRGTETVSVRRAWATFDLFGLGQLLVGRAPDHFGLGLWRNDGRDRRSDFQSDVDRVAIRGDIFGLRLHISRDAMAALPMVSKGPSSQDPALSLQDSADVTRWLAQVEGGALAAKAQGLRWGVALAYQDQAVGLRIEHADDPAAKLNEGCVETGVCNQLVPRDALLVTPQAYVGWRGKTGLGVLRVEAEGVLRFATVDNTDVLANTDTGTTFIGGALAGQLSLRRGASDFRLKAGFASGDSEGGFGVLDRSNLTVIDPVTKQEVRRSLVTGIATHRGFLVDGLLFREVIGAVANAWYVRPALRWHVTPQTPDGGLSLELGCLVAGAAQWGATPGKRALLGVEPELSIDARFGRFGGAAVDFSYLLPGPGFDAGRGGTPAKDAWRLSAAWVVDF